MSRAVASRDPSAVSIATGTLACALAAVWIAGATAAFVIAAGLSDEARATLRFGFGGVDHTRGQAVRIAIHNLRVTAGTLVCALVIPRLPRWTRIATDSLLATALALNAGTAGVAFGAYGWRAVAATAPHLPVEFAAFSLAGGAYLHARAQPLCARSLIATAAGCVLLLAAAAFVETYVSMR